MRVRSGCLLFRQCIYDNGRNFKIVIIITHSRMVRIHIHTLNIILFRDN